MEETCWRRFMSGTEPKTFEECEIPRWNFGEIYLWIWFHWERKVTHNLRRIMLAIDCKRFLVWRSPKCREELPVWLYSEMLCIRATANSLLVFLPNPKAVFRSFLGLKIDLVSHKLWRLSIRAGRPLDGFIIANTDWNDKNT